MFPVINFKMSLPPTLCRFSEIREKTPPDELDHRDPKLIKDT